MDLKIVTIFCHTDDFIKQNSLKDDIRASMSLAEVVTVGVVSWHLFSGNIEHARRFLRSEGYITKMLSKSRLNRRLHAIPEFFWHMIVSYLGQISSVDQDRVFIVDSFPVLSCQSVRSSHRKRCCSKQFVGYNASKKTWIVGVKAHLIIGINGQVKEFVLTPASKHDAKAFNDFYLGTVPARSVILGDKAYSSKALENRLLKNDLHLTTDRKKNEKRGNSLAYVLYGKKIRKRIETVFSDISRKLPKSLHAITTRGFCLKIVMLIASYAFSPIKFN